MKRALQYKKWHMNHKLVVVIGGLSLLLIGLLFFSPKQKILGRYDFEELSPAVSRYPNFYAIMIEPNDFQLDLHTAVVSALVDLSSTLNFERFILIHQEAIAFNPAAFDLWATAFQLRGQDIHIETAPDRSGLRRGYYAIAFLYNEESEASRYARMSSQMDESKIDFEGGTIRHQYRHPWISPSVVNSDLRAEARLRLTFDSSLNESINVVTFQNEASKRWPFLLAIDTSRQEALANGFPYFIVLEANISGEMVAMQVRTRYLKSPEIPEDLYKRGYRSFMIQSTSAVL
ncbi:hypothetical protein PVA45_06915 [Entomospira entomophila]|uniref:Uncharacterized protein n=1 Tax=Entomospira entomophila TaxID=2719988 RepID=A0A968G9Y0_9SPIO|nr:hypothetical protein [Entomospira entomophilus]NIZ41232.1 hypothetical protein [Entomospira entomophilus]WDI35437.1 hypothetical protein PVA45_06915 [Entomospira entomophilus]